MVFFTFCVDVWHRYNRYMWRGEKSNFCPYGRSRCRVIPAVQKEARDHVSQVCDTFWSYCARTLWRFGACVPFDPHTLLSLSATRVQCRQGARTNLQCSLFQCCLPLQGGSFLALPMCGAEHKYISKFHTLPPSLHLGPGQALTLCHSASYTNDFRCQAHLWKAASNQGHYDLADKNLFLPYHWLSSNLQHLGSLEVLVGSGRSAGGVKDEQTRGASPHTCLTDVPFERTVHWPPLERVWKRRSRILTLEGHWFSYFLQ